MFMRSRSYRFTSRMWKHPGTGGWHFVTVPSGISRQIRKHHARDEEGWGRLRVRDFDTRLKRFLLPLKAAVRKSLQLESGVSIEVVLRVDISIQL